MTVKGTRLYEKYMNDVILITLCKQIYTYVTNNV